MSTPFCYVVVNQNGDKCGETTFSKEDAQIELEDMRKHHGNNLRIQALYMMLPAFATLVDVLGEMVDVAQRVSVCEVFPSDVVVRAIDALAAYRNGGEE